MIWIVIIIVLAVVVVAWIAVEQSFDGYQPRYSGPTPDPSKIELPTGNGACQPKTVIAMPPEEFQQRANEIMDEIRDKYTLHIHEPVAIKPTDVPAEDAINEQEFKDLVYDKLRKRIAANMEDEALEHGFEDGWKADFDFDWRPLPMADLRRKPRD